MKFKTALLVAALTFGQWAWGGDFDYLNVLSANDNYSPDGNYCGYIIRYDQDRGKVFATLTYNWFLGQNCNYQALLTFKCEPNVPVCHLEASTFGGIRKCRLHEFSRRSFRHTCEGTATDSYYYLY